MYWGFGKIYFFYGDEYVRYDVTNDAVDPDYLPPNAAVNWGNGKAYFFRGPKYLR